MNKLLSALGLVVLVSLMVESCGKTEESSAPNNAPSVIGIGAVENGLVDSVYTFQCTVNDPDGDRVAVRFAWGDGDTSAWTDFRDAGSTFELQHAYSHEGSYSLKAQAKDERGALSEWSASRTVRIVYFPFVMTQNSYPDTCDLTAAVQSEFGQDYTLADWNDVKGWCQTHSASEFISYLNWELGEAYSLLVTKDGEHYWNGRHYFMSRFDHNPPLGYLIHDDIEDNYIVLGSWSPVSFRVLGIKQAH